MAGARLSEHDILYDLKFSRSLEHRSLHLAPLFVSLDPAPGETASSHAAASTVSIGNPTGSRVQTSPRLLYHAASVV
jgi:hypothetical protein